MPACLSSVTATSVRAAGGTDAHRMLVEVATNSGSARLLHLAMLEVLPIAAFIKTKLRKQHRA